MKGASRRTRGRILDWLVLAPSSRTQGADEVDVYRGRVQP